MCADADVLFHLSFIAIHIIIQNQQIKKGRPDITAYHNLLKYFLFSIILVFIVLGMVSDGIPETVNGFLRLQISSSRLISDFIEMESIGAALLNSALVGLMAFVLILINKVTLSGPTFAAVFTIMGFGLFGKTPLNIFPIIFGVFLSAKLVGKSFKEYIIIALFGTALGPLISFFAFELAIPPVLSILLGMFMGTATGFLLPAIAVAMLHLHQGYNLYNMGLSCGFLGLFAAALIKAGGQPFAPLMNWSSDKSIVLILLVPLLSVSCIVLALIKGRKECLKSFIKIQKQSGRLPSDFMDSESAEGALFNAGVIGLTASAYILLIGADFNGPVLGGLLTIMGFSVFGTHLRNSFPVVAGVVAATLIFNQSFTALAAAGPVLAFIFSTTLGPLAGQFGILTGFLAGMVHYIMVMQTGSWHGGMNLYNNGFAGGLTAALFVAVIQWYKNNKSGR